jgi:hypothetical protein
MKQKRKLDDMKGKLKNREIKQRERHGNKIYSMLLRLGKMFLSKI